MPLSLVFIDLDRFHRMFIKGIVASGQFLLCLADYHLADVWSVRGYNDDCMVLFLTNKFLIGMGVLVPCKSYVDDANYYLFKTGKSQSQVCSSKLI